MHLLFIPFYSREGHFDLRCLFLYEDQIKMTVHKIWQCKLFHVEYKDKAGEDKLDIIKARRKIKIETVFLQHTSFY